jgi:hypothetical protein
MDKKTNVGVSKNTGAGHDYKYSFKTQAGMVYSFIAVN